MDRFGARLVIVAILVAFVASACSLSGLAFVEDERISIRQPKENAEVSLPFTLSWKATDVDGRVAIFFDRSPMRPDHDMASLVGEHDLCRDRPGCPDAQWMTEQRIYVSDGTSVEIDALPDDRPNNRSKDRHEVTIVVLGEDGKRSGESSVYREFIVERDDR